jgi:hypothetical protein
VPIAEMQAGEVGVGALIDQPTRWIAASGAASRRGPALRSTSCPIAVEPIADGPSRQFEIATDRAECDALSPEPQGSHAQVRRVHALNCRTGVRQFSWCRGRESNPHALSGKSF